MRCALRRTAARAVGVGAAARVERGGHAGVVTRRWLRAAACQRRARRGQARRRPLGRRRAPRQRSRQLGELFVREGEPAAQLGIELGLARRGRTGTCSSEHDGASHRRRRRGRSSSGAAASRRRRGRRARCCGRRRCRATALGRAGSQSAHASQLVRRAHAGRRAGRRPAARSQARALSPQRREVGGQQHSARRRRAQRGVGALRTRRASSAAGRGRGTARRSAPSRRRPPRGAPAARSRPAAARRSSVQAVDAVAWPCRATGRSAGRAAPALTAMAQRRASATSSNRLVAARARSGWPAPSSGTR